MWWEPSHTVPDVGVVVIGVSDEDEAAGLSGLHFMKRDGSDEWWVCERDGETIVRAAAPDVWTHFPKSRAR